MENEYRDLPVPATPTFASIKILGHKIPIIGKVGKNGKVTFYKGKNNMADQIKITVKVNGVETPLHQISELTLSKIREASKPKEILVARTADTPYDNRRLILKVPKNIDAFIKSEFIVIDLKNGSIQNNYEYGETRKPKNYYNNIQVIS